MQISLWFFLFFDFLPNMFLFLFYWFQLCLLIYAHKHQIPLHTALLELIGFSFLFILTVGELHCWLNSWLSWMELSTAGREQALVMLLVYLKVRIVFVLTILKTYLPSWPAAPRGTYEEEANDSDGDTSACFLYFFFYMCVCAFFFICDEMKSLLWSYPPKVLYICSLPKSIVVVFFYLSFASNPWYNIIL